MEKLTRTIVAVAITIALAQAGCLAVPLIWGAPDKAPEITPAADNQDQEKNQKGEKGDKPPPCALDEKARWTDYEKALGKAEDEEKPIVLFFHAKYCGPCDKLEKKSFNDPKVACYLNQNLVATKVLFEGEREIAYKYRVNFTPTIVFLTPKAKTIEKVVGYYDPKTMYLFLTYIGEKAYMDMSFDEFKRRKGNHK